MHAREALTPHHFRDVGIYGDHVVSTVRKIVEQGDTHAAWVAGDADNGNALLGEEVVNRVEGSAGAGMGPPWQKCGL